MDTPLDTPGSPSAVKKGCVCPVEDNEGGKGYRPALRTGPSGGGAAIFWISDLCQLHAPKNAGEILEKLSQDPYTKAEATARKRGRTKELLTREREQARRRRYWEEQR